MSSQPCKGGRDARTQVTSAENVVPQVTGDVSDSNTVCRLRLIGHMEAWAANGESVLPIGRKTRAMLAIVALSAPRPILRSRLADLLWSRRHEEQARASLRQELHRLLEALQPIGSKILDVTRDHVVLRPGLVWVDVHQIFNATTADANALVLLEGELLEEFNDVDPALDQWLAAERIRLRDQARSVAEAVLGAQAGADHAIPAAQRLLSIDRSHEGAWRALMSGYAAKGERGKAIQAYEQCRGVLTDLLDAAPLPDTQRLAAEIRAGQIPTPARVPARVEPSVAPTSLRNTVKIGALPCHTISAGAEEAQFSLGLAEEMTVALTRFGALAVVSSSSLLQFGDRNEPALRSAFGLDFLLDGSIQRAGSRFRITLRLLDLRDGSKVVWTYRADQQVRDLLALQDEVAAEVASQVDLEMQRIDAVRITQRPTSSHSAHDLITCALPLMTRLRRDEYRQAGDLIDSAMRMEPELALAHVWKAWWLLLGIGQGWAANIGHAGADAAGYATRAVALDSQDAVVLTIAGHIRAFVQHKPAEGLEMHSRALLINANLAMAWGLTGMCYLYIGAKSDADRHFARFKKLSPSDPNAFIYNAGEAILALLQGFDDLAATLGRRATELHPGYVVGLKHYLAILGHTNHSGDARPVLDRLLASEPHFSVQTFLVNPEFERASDRQLYATGLRLAGVPEEAGASQRANEHLYND